MKIMVSPCVLNLFDIYTYIYIILSAPPRIYIYIKPFKLFKIWIVSRNISTLKP